MNNKNKYTKKNFHSCESTSPAQGIDEPMKSEDDVGQSESDDGIKDTIASKAFP